MTRFNFLLILVVCGVMCAGVVLGQGNAVDGGTLRGKITDTTRAQNPIEGVEIKIVAQDGTEFTTTTDANGNYKHAGLPAGRYLINISKEGFGERIGKPVVIVNGGDHFMPLKMSNKGDVILPPLHVHGRRMDAVVKVRIESLLQRVTESIGKRYNLDEVVVKALHQSILDSIDSVLLQTESRSAFAKAMGNGNAVLLNMLLSRPDCKAAFTEHLSEAQLRDYVDFAAARQQRDQHAAAHQITMLLDQELSLTPAQREKVVQLLRDEIENETAGNAMRVLRISSPQAAAQLARYRLKIPMDGILSKVQSKIWLGLITADAHKEIMGGGGTVRGMITDTTPAQNPIEGVEVQVVAVAREGRNLAFIATTDAKGNYRHDGIPAGRYFINIYREGYGDRLGKPVTVVNGGDHFVPLKMLKIRKKVENIFDLFVPNRTRKKKDTADTAEPPSMRQFIEAKLQAHTELLGPLDEHASQRLALATKGVVQQHFEARDERREKTLQGFETDLREKIEAGEMTREQALSSLEAIKKNLLDKNSAINTSGITTHRLYQQAIKDVLSEEAYAQYSAHQAERRALRRQALWDLVVACMDTQLLLDNTQRKHLETAVKVFAPLSRRNSPRISMFFLLFQRQRNFKILTPWQQAEFKRVFGPIALERK
ncbi:carboxypeptidase regulatory-like domain-containing protein [Candidatus Poribacteria bacterium]|nr:carboxypeptidase regulatory-like domain-containing protein [Candidatus Poribacteria bacterium]